MINSKEKGLSTSEVEKLQEKYGRNEIEEKFQSTFVRFLKKFIGPIPLMIEVALVFSAIIRKWEDFSIILVLLLINIGVDFIKEKKAKKALEALKKTLSPKALVLRNGKFSNIDAKELVPGDIIKITIGDIIPADSVLLGDNYLYIDQSTITGESLPVEKKTGDTIYSSSVVQKGVSLARVKTIGKNTFIGKSAQLVIKAESEKVSHFQKAILGVAKFLIILSLFLITIVFTVLILRDTSIIESIRFALVLAIASVPVALPTVLSVTMAIGASKLAKKNTIVTNFKAIEELAGVDELCIDKTGTLTKNEIVALNPKTYNNFEISDLFTYALLSGKNENKTSIGKAIYLYAKKNNLIEKSLTYSIDKYIPFNPTKKITTVLAHSASNTINIIMGATQVIGKYIKDTESEQLSKDVETFARNGFKTLAIARKEKDIFKLVGIIPLIDPPRDDSISAISEIKQKGIKIKMLTGDNTAIALYIANILGIGKRIIESSFLQNLRKNKEVKKEISTIVNTDIFTEIVPEDKYHIVDMLQKNGHIVAMTGDGVNDAPALEKADIGIAVSNASPAARSVADIVMLDNGLLVIKTAISIARRTFSRMQSYATFRIAETMRIIFFITFAMIFFNYSPVSVVMIILLALLNDIPVMSIAYDNAPEHKKPVHWHLNETLFIATVLGVSGLIASFLLFYWLNVSGYFIAVIQTVIFLKLDVSGHSILYLTRAGKKHFWKRPYPSLKFFLPAFGSRTIGTLFAVYGIFMTPIGWTGAMYIWIYSMIWFLINDQLKVFAYKALDKFKNRNSFHVMTQKFQIIKSHLF